MQARCEPPARFQDGRSVLIDDILDALLTESIVGQRHPAESRSRMPRPCDHCGIVTADVDLWAEHSETGEQLWLCPTCGDP